MLLGSRETRSLSTTRSISVESIGFETEFDKCIFDLLVFTLLLIARKQILGRDADERTDHIGLLTACESRAHRIVCHSLFGERERRSSAGALDLRWFTQIADRRCAIERKGKRTRDGCCAHRKDIGTRSFRQKRFALLDAEALLLIEAYERAIGKLYRRLEYGMGAETDRNLSFCKRLECALLLICWGR